MTRLNELTAVFESAVKEAYDKGFAEGKKVYLQEAASSITSGQVYLKKSNNQQRYETIEQAKRFVKHHTERKSETDGMAGIPFSIFVVREEFIVNYEKRTVVCLLKGANIPDIYSRGIAKCDPSDVFNADIGKAIALARALEIEIPVEFVDAVQPDEVVVGMTVGDGDYEESGSYFSDYVVGRIEFRDGRTMLHDASVKGFARADCVYIIDDSNAEYSHE